MSNTHTIEKVAPGYTAILLTIAAKVFRYVFFFDGPTLIVNGFPAATVAKTGKVWTVTPVEDNLRCLVPVSGRTKKAAVEAFVLEHCRNLSVPSYNVRRPQVQWTECPTCKETGCQSRFDCIPARK